MPSDFRHSHSSPHNQRPTRRKVGARGQRQMPHGYHQPTKGFQPVQGYEPKAHGYQPQERPTRADGYHPLQGYPPETHAYQYPQNYQPDPHLSASAIPQISAEGVPVQRAAVSPSANTPHPNSPAGRAQRKAYATGRFPDQNADTGFADVSGTPKATAHKAPYGQPQMQGQSYSPEQTQAPGVVAPGASGMHAPVNNEAVNTAQSNNPYVMAQNAPTMQQNYADYSAASGRYKARPSANMEGGSSFVPVTPGGTHARRKKKPFPRVAAAIAIILVLCLGGYFGYQHFVYNGPIKATVNGETVTLEGSQRSIEGLLDNNIVKVTPGNFVAVDNSVMREGDGTRCTAVLNEQPVTDLKTHINEGDAVVVSNGTDVMENYSDSAPEITPAGYSKVGQWGALHVFLPGQDGETVTRTGAESGKTVKHVLKEKIDERLVYYNANTNGAKVVALTFDDGPWDTTTDQILDILKENGAKATFYTIGNQMSSHQDQVKRMVADGHELATHTWDHAEGSGKGVSLDLMSTEERKTEVEKGLAIIKEISGKDASMYFRAPGGNFNDKTASDLKSLIKGEIGWNVDTEDWRRPGADTIASRIKSVKPGEVVLMHDGGGDRSQTVAGLRDAIKYLKGQGYEFVTISELIEKYPYQEGQSS